MSFSHNEDHAGGGRARHLSVSHYAINAADPRQASFAEVGRRRSSIAPANSVSAVGAPSNEGKLNQKDDTLRRMSVAVPNLAELTTDAKNCADAERKMTFREGARLYPKAILFSFGLSLAVIMEGYDTFLIGNFYGMRQFAKKYGGPAAIVDGVQTYQVGASWQSALSNGGQVGSIIGLFLNGIISERIGYRKTMIGALCLIICFIFLNFFAVNIHMLLAGYILCGIPWGVFQTLTTTYAAEVTPVNLRAYLTTYVNLCWVIGQLIAAGVLRGFVSNTTQWAYRIPYAIQWIWPIPIMIVAFLAPESPWWLVRHGKLDEARASLLRLTSQKNNPDFNVEDTLAMMIHTNELEIQQSSGTSYIDCFKGIDLRRTEITCVVWLIQTTCGSPMIGTGIYFLEQVGISDTAAYSIGIGQSAMGAVGTITSWFLMPHVGRRTLYLYGQYAMLLILIIIGCLSIPSTKSSLGYGSGALILVYTFIYDFTVGPVCYSLVAEIPSTRLRIKTVVLARNLYNLGGIVVNILQPRFLNPTAWNWKGKTAFFWAGACAFSIVWTYFRLPEPKGLTYAELDVLFENKVSARKFRAVQVDPYRSDNLVVTQDDDSEENEKVNFNENVNFNEKV